MQWGWALTKRAAGLQRGLSPPAAPHLQEAPGSFPCHPCSFSSSVLIGHFWPPSPDTHVTQQMSTRGSRCCSIRKVVWSPQCLRAQGGKGFGLGAPGSAAPGFCTQVVPWGSPSSGKPPRTRPRGRSTHLATPQHRPTTLSSSRAPCAAFLPSVTSHGDSSSREVPPGRQVSG